MKTVSAALLMAGTAIATDAIQAIDAADAIGAAQSIYGTCADGVTILRPNNAVLSGSSSANTGDDKWYNHNRMTPSCAGYTWAGDHIFSINVAAGEKLNIRQTSNNFDSIHELTWGGSCPGNNVVRCIDDWDLTPMQWTNTEGSTQTAYFLVDGYAGSEGSFTIDWTVTPPPAPTPQPTPPPTAPPSCSSAYGGLTNLRDPSAASGTTHSTVAAANDRNPSCHYWSHGSGEQMFYIDLTHGETLNIKQSHNTYDSVHELRFGGDCPGNTLVRCIDDWDLTPMQWTNTEGSTQRAYFIVDGYHSGEGTFELDWSVSTASPTEAPTAYPTAYPTASPTKAPTAACVPGQSGQGEGDCQDCGIGTYSTTYNAPECKPCLAHPTNGAWTHAAGQSDDNCPWGCANGHSPTHGGTKCDAQGATLSLKAGSQTALFTMHKNGALKLSGGDDVCIEAPTCAPSGSTSADSHARRLGDMGAEISTRFDALEARMAALEAR